MATIHDMVDAETFSAYDSADAILAITRAYQHCSPLVDEDNQLDIKAGTTLGNTNLELDSSRQQEAVTMLAVIILINARKHEKSKAQDITPTSIESLMTDEIRNMLLIGDETDEGDTDEGVMWSNAQPVDSWDASGVRL